VCRCSSRGRYATSWLPELCRKPRIPRIPRISAGEGQPRMARITRQTGSHGFRGYHGERSAADYADPIPTVRPAASASGRRQPRAARRQARRLESVCSQLAAVLPVDRRGSKGDTVRPAASAPGRRHDAATNSRHKRPGIGCRLCVEFDAALAARCAAAGPSSRLNPCHPWNPRPRI
jgi:hypothetical protein